jgi:hypothetical protein
MGSVSAASSNRMPLSPDIGFRWSILFLRTASGMPLGKASQVGKLFLYVRLSLCLYLHMEHKGNVSTNGWRFIPPPPLQFRRLLNLEVAYFVMTWQAKIVDCGMRNLPSEIRCPKWKSRGDWPWLRDSSPLTNPQAFRKIHAPYKDESIC